MKKIYKYFYLALFFTASNPLNSNTENSTIDYSKVSSAELDEAFSVAVEHHNLESMKELIRAGANINTPIKYWLTYGSGEGGMDVECTNTALIYAINKNYPDIVKMLLKVKTKLTTPLGKALCIAAKQGCSAIIVEELIKNGADINYKYGYNQDTPLIVAIQERRRWLIDILLKAGVDVSLTNKDGSTALMEAVREHDLDTVLDLLKNPAMAAGSFFGFFGTKPLNYADKDGNTAVIIAINYIRSKYTVGNQREYNICINSQKIAETLLKFPGIDLYHTNNKGETAIMLLEKLNKN